MARYEPLSIYDAPDVIFTQAMQGEANYRTIMNTMLRPNTLGIEERDSFADSLKEAMGSHSVTNAMVDVIKNPFFWLLFVTSPVAHPALKRGKDIIFDRGAMLGAYMKKNPDLLGKLGILTGQQYFSGAPGVGAVIGDVSQAIDRSQRRVAEWLSTPEAEFRMLHGLTRGMNPNMYTDPRKKEIIEMYDMALFGALTRAHEGGTMKVAEAGEAMGLYKFTDKKGIPPVSELKGEKIVYGKEAQAAQEAYDAALLANPKAEPPFYIRRLPTKEGNVEIKIVPREIEAWEGRNPFEVLEEIGAMPIFKAYDTMRKQYFKEMFLRPLNRGKANHAQDIEGNLIQNADKIIDDVEYVVDPNKAMRMWRANQNPLFTRDIPKGKDFDPVAARGMQLLNHVMGKDMAEALWMNMVEAGQGAGMTAPKFYEIISKIIRETTDVTRYLPRNVLEVLGRDGKKVTPELVAQLRRGPEVMSTSRAIPRAAFDVFWHPDDLKRYAKVMGGGMGAEGMSRAFQDLSLRNELRMAGRIGEPGIGHALVQRMDPVTSMTRYSKDMMESKALYIDAVSEEYHASQAKNFTRSFQQDKQHVLARHGSPVGAVEPALLSVPMRETEAKAAELGQAQIARNGKMDIREMNIPAGGFSNADAMWAEYNMLGNADAQIKFSNILIPTTLGRLSGANVTGYLASWTAQEALKGLMKTPIPKWMAESGTWGKNFSKQLKTWSELDITEMLNSRGIANVLYVTHLGYNMSSVLLNMMQPLLMTGPMVGMENLAHGYREAFKELGKYYTARKKYGWRISDVDKEKVIRSSFKWSNHHGVDLLDIHPNIHHTVDAIGQAAPGFGVSSWPKFLAMEAPMKMFEKAEWLNRLVTSHATERMVRTLNPGMSEVFLARNVRDMVRETQYGADIMNTPLMSLPHRPASGGGRARNFFSDPTFRQFLTFPIRTATAFTYTPKLIGQGIPKAAGAEGRQKQFLEDWPILVSSLRGMGYGAVAHSVAKNMMGADIKRGLFPQAALDLIEGDRFVQGGDTAFPVMTPPVMNITADFLTWLTGPEEAKMLNRWLPRVIPGGVGARRLTSLIPSPDQDWALGRFVRDMQNFYVGWNEPRFDGLVPVYKSDGTLVSYQKPTTMILRALGMDMRKFGTEAQMDRWLAKNRDAASGVKRSFMTAVLNQDWSEADKLAKEHQNKFGIPLRLTRSQLSSQMRTRTLTRTERLLDRMSPDLRERYIAAIQHKAPALGLTQEQLGKTTATQRTEAGAKRPTPLTPEAQEYLEAYMKEDPSGVFRRFGSGQ